MYTIVCMCVCIHMYIYIYIYMHKEIHMSITSHIYARTVNDRQRHTVKSMLMINNHVL